MPLPSHAGRAGRPQICLSFVSCLFPHRVLCSHSNILAQGHGPGLGLHIQVDTFLSLKKYPFYWENTFKCWII